MTNTKALMRSACVGAILAATGMSGASAQQTIAPASATPVPGPMPEILRAYAPVTAERLKKPEDGNWLMFRRTFDGWGYSPLDEINRENVSRLQPVWSFATGQVEGHQAPPIVNNGVMFVATPGNQLLAMEAKSGKILWRYKRPFPEDMTPLHPTNRGVGLYGDKVYFAAAEAILVALDAKTGKEVWTAKVDDYKKGYYMSLAPLVVDGKVLLGASGGELGVRGFLAAFDAETGKELWKTYTVPAPGEPGSETWPAGGDHYKRGGASIWITGTYDPETNLTFWGTGNGGPWFGDQRPGDNLYTSSVVAFDATSGAIKGHFQYHPNDSWDWDEVSPPLVLDYQRDGATVTSGSSSAPTTRSTSSSANPTCVRTSSRASIPRPGGRISMRRASPAPTRPPSSARVCGAARIGRRSPTARRRACSTFPPTTTCAPNSPAKRPNTCKASASWESRKT